MRVLHLALVVALTTLACAGDDNPVAPSATNASVDVPISAVAANGPVLLGAMGQTKTDICHAKGTNEHVLRPVNDKALSQHLAHGDGFVGDPVPGSPGMFFDETCAPIPPITIFTDANSFLASTGAVAVSIPGSGLPAPSILCPPAIPLAFDSNQVTVTGVLGNSLCIFDAGLVVTPTGNTIPDTMTANTIVGNGEDDYLLTFNSPVQAVGFRFLTNNAANELLTFRDEVGVAIQTVDIDNYTPTNVRVFVGFDSAVPIGSVVIDTVNGAVQNEGFDQLYVAPAP